MADTPEFTELAASLNERRDSTLSPLETLIASGDIRVTESMKGFRPHIMTTQKGAETLKAIGVNAVRTDATAQNAIGPYLFGEHVYLLERSSLVEASGSTQELHTILQENNAQPIPFTQDFLDAVCGVSRSVER